MKVSFWVELWISEYNTHNINNQENNATCWSPCVTTAHICYHKVTPSLYMNDKLCGSFSDMQLFQSYTEETQQMTCWSSVDGAFNNER